MRVVVTIGAVLVLGACGKDDSTLPVVTAISPEGARHSSPSYSPDGKHLAWWGPATDSSADWQLWAGGSGLTSPVMLPVTAAILSMPVWSPDGARIAAISSQQGTGHVVIVSPSGGDAKPLTHGTGIEIPLSFEKNGDRLSYFGTAEGGTFNSRVVSTKSGVSTLLVPGETRPLFGSVSPDGSHIAFFLVEGAKSTVWVADSIGGKARQLTTEGFESLEQDLHLHIYLENQILHPRATAMEAGVPA